MNQQLPTELLTALRFCDLGMRFKLFEGPISSADVDTTSKRPCAQCHRSAPVLFERVCFECFRAGLSPRTANTVYGMVRPEDATRGLTHGIPLADPDELSECELIAQAVDPKFPDEKWYSVRIDSAELMELTRTPRYHSYQGEQWQFCCLLPCIYVGEWSHKKWVEKAVEKGVSLESCLASAFRLSDSDDAEELAFSLEEETVRSYVFRCQRCEKTLTYFDRT